MPSLIVSAAERVPDVATLLAPLRADGAMAHLALGYRALEGRVWGGARATVASSDESAGLWATVDGILLPGAGMHDLRVISQADLDAAQHPQRLAWPLDLERWSRTIGALGAHVWQRLTSLRLGIIGCGRTGSLIATTAVRMGVRDLTLIDPDLVERHNLGEMDGVSISDVGRSKVQALADFLHRQCGRSHEEMAISAVAEPVVTAYRAALPADVLFCCVDNDAARLACGIIATLFHKVLIDVGTGILNEPASSASAPLPADARLMGADVRLILPADGCLICFGNLANYEAALAELAHGNRKPRADRQRWWEQRQGSLRTLNMLAASLAMQMLCDLIAGRIQSSAWMQVRYDRSGAISVERLTRSSLPAPGRCFLCLRAGLGDDGLMW